MLALQQILLKLVVFLIVEVAQGLHKEPVLSRRLHCLHRDLEHGFGGFHFVGAVRGQNGR